VSHFLAPLTVWKAGPYWTGICCCKKEGSSQWSGTLHFQHEGRGKQGQNLPLGEQECHYACGVFLLLRLVVCGAFFASHAKMTTKGLAKSLEWISELACINSLVGLMSVGLQGKKTDCVSIYECRCSIHRRIVPKQW